MLDIFIAVLLQRNHGALMNTFQQQKSDSAFLERCLLHGRYRLRQLLNNGLERMRMVTYSFVSILKRNDHPPLTIGTYLFEYLS